MRVCLALGIPVPRQLRAARQSLVDSLGRVAETWLVRWARRLRATSRLTLRVHRTANVAGKVRDAGWDSRKRRETQFGPRSADESSVSPKRSRSSLPGGCSCQRARGAQLGDESSADYCLALISEEVLRGLARGRDAVAPAGALRWSLRAARSIASARCFCSRALDLIPCADF